MKGAGVYFEGDPFLPPVAELPGCLARLCAYLRRQKGLSDEELLAGFTGVAASAAAFHLRGIDHVAAYLGDYRREEEVEAWLERLAGRPEVADLKAGPSAIAPRVHGTPGWWLSCRLAGTPVELFTCKHAGRWSALAPARRRDLMSHFALAVDGAEHVEPLLRWLCHYSAIELLAFQETDELGHTYGHLFHRGSGRVLELVHDPAHAAGGRGELHAERLPENAAGPWFVDARCVDCDTCRAIAPEHFRRRAERGYSYLWRQPATAAELARVEEACACCPVGAIGREAV